MAGCHVILPTLVGERSFRIREVYGAPTDPMSFHGSADDDEFNEKEEPKSFHFINIYRRSNIERLLYIMLEVDRRQIHAERAFDPERISPEVSSHSPLVGGPGRKLQVQRLLPPAVVLYRDRHIRAIGSLARCRSASRRGQSGGG